jgi:hypothetical protein
MITTKDARVGRSPGAADKLPLLDISDDTVFFVKQGLTIQTAIYEKVHGLKKSLADTMSLINNLITSKEEAVTLMVVLLHTSSGDMNENGHQVHSLSKHANEMMLQIEYLSRISKNLQSDYLYKLNAEDAKRYGL